MSSQGQNPQFITSLVSKLKLEYYANEDMVVAEHDIGSEMYFVVNGMLEARKYNKITAAPKSVRPSLLRLPSGPSGTAGASFLHVCRHTCLNLWSPSSPFRPPAGC